jgi:phenylalanyl-tRNA synthetase beta chain
MNIGYQWLRALVPELTAAPEEIAEMLAMRGAPVEELLHLGEGLEDIVIARVEAVRPHPNADRLSLCTVEGGEGEVQVVCGAPNVRAGAYYPFAPVGATLPGGMKIRKAKIRGESSVGMLCSEKELALGRDSGGIMELRGAWTPGASMVDALRLDDARLDVEVTPNRGDLLSHLGVAREVSPAGVDGIRLPTIPGLDASPELRFADADADADIPSGGVAVHIEDPDLCSRYIAAVVRGITVGPSPEWLQARLRSVGARPINNVVDATNYVLLELGHPLHAFDLRTLKGPEIIVRRVKKGEAIRTLDDVERKLAPDMLAICDAAGPVAIAGVMGGADTEVTEDSQDILLECALFDPASTRATRRALGMSTDASYRFERGVDPEGMERAVRRAVEIILATAGGEAEPQTTDVVACPFERVEVALRPARVGKVLGVPFEDARIREILEPLGFPVDGPGGAASGDRALSVSVPGFRSYDVRREIDLVEEISRVHGFDRFPDVLGAFRPGTVPDDALFGLQDELRDLLVARGLLEAQTPAFAPAAEGDVEVLNPVSAEDGALRRSLLPALFRRMEYNFARGARDIRLFETGTVFGPPPKKGERPHEETRIAVVLTGDREPAHWATPAMPVDLWEVKGILEAVLGSSRHPEWTLDSIGDVAAATRFDRGAAWEARGADGVVLGYGGRVAAGVVDAPAWAGDLWALEIVLPENPEAPEPPLFRALPHFPGVARDVALIVPDAVPADEVARVIGAHGGEYLERVQLFDLYRGEAIPESTRSIAFRLHFRSPERTLTDADVEAAMKRIDEALREEAGVQPRGP